MIRVDEEDVLITGSHFIRYELYNDSVRCFMNMTTTTAGRCTNLCWSRFLAAVSSRYPAVSGSEERWLSSHLPIPGFEVFGGVKDRGIVRVRARVNIEIFMLLTKGC